MLHLSNNLKKIRRLLDKTQAEFAEMLGVSVAMQKSYEGAKANPDRVYIDKLSDLTKFHAHDLLNREIPSAEIVEKVEPKVIESKPETIGSTYTTRTSLERTLENLSEDKLKSTAIIERLVVLLERQLGENTGPHLVEPGTPGTIPINKKAKTNP